MGQTRAFPARRARARVALAVALASIPVILLILKATFWVRHGIDLPISDDWDAYIERSVGSFDPSYLMAAENDTIFPVGKLLDAIAHMTLGGNTVVYQLTSMLTVMGALLALQWTLLRWAFRDTLHAAIPFSACGLMLMNRAYWGGPNLEYHQLLPLLFILAALTLALRPARATRSAVLAGSALGLLAGLTYISGAFGALAAGLTLVVIGSLGRSHGRRRLSTVGTGLAGAGLATVTIQVLATGVFRGESMEHGGLVLPSEADFWFFMAGKVGASIGVDPWHPHVALALTSGAILLGIGAIVWALRSAWVEPPEPPRSEVVSVVTLALASTIFVYLALVSAARAHSWPFDEPPGAVQIFQSGFHFFHFGWVTAFWPWVAAVGLSLLLVWTRRLPSLVRATGWALVVAAPVLAVLVAWNSGSFDFVSWYRTWAAHRASLNECLLKNMQGDDGRGCEGLPPDLGGLISYARSIDASWVRYLRTVPFAPSDPLFSMRDSSLGVLESNNADVRRLGNGLHIGAADDAQLIVTLADADAMERCRSLEVRALLRPTEDDMTQLFYLRPGEEWFSPDHVSTVGVEARDGAWTSVTHLVFSETGFAERIRFDPVFTPQVVDLAELEVYCRMSAK